MRLINRKKVEEPEFFRSAAVMQARKNASAVFALSKARQLKTRAAVNSKLILRPDVARALFELFDEQCAFCGNCLASASIGYIEALRPQMGAQQINGDTSLHHYVWLAYDWENLYLACPSCARAKSNRFPVSGARGAPNTPLAKLVKEEQGTILDPCRDDPSEHLFYDWNGLCHAATARGRITIQILDLNREQLVVARKKIARTIQTVCRRTSGKSEPLLRMLDGKRRPYTGVVANLLRRRMAWPASTTPKSDGEVAEAIRSLPAPLQSQLLGALGPPPSQSDIAKRTVIRAVTSKTHKRHNWPARKRIAATARIKSIEIHNFKAIEHLKFELAEKSLDAGGDASCLALLGENSTGKTSILEAIALCVLGTKAIENLNVRASDYGHRTDARRWKSRPSLPLQVSLEFYGVPAPVTLRWSPHSRGFRGAEDPAAILLAYGPRRYFTKARKKHFTSPWKQVQTLFNPLATIPHPELWLRRADKQAYAAAVRALREILLLKEKDDIIRGPHGSILVRTQGVLTPLDSLSEGYRSMVALAVDVMRELLEHWNSLEHASGIVLIDEVETHLHPRWKMRIMDALRRALPGVQFIVTTHDPLCLRGMANGEVQVLQRSPVSGIELLEDLPDIRGLRADQLLTSDYFGLSSTSDPEFERELKEYEDLAGKPAPTRADNLRRSELSQRLSQTMAVGDTAQEQIVNEGVTRFIAEAEKATKELLDSYIEKRRSMSSSERRAGRDQAVQAVISALRQSSTEEASSSAADAPSSEPEADA